MPLEEAHPLRLPPAMRANDLTAAGKTKTVSTSPDESLRHALIVGSDLATLRYCRDALESSGFAVDVVDSGIAAVVAAREELPDLVFVDVQLRDVPGREAIKWLRSIPALKSTPIIVLNTSAEDDVAPVLARPCAKLPKPVSFAAIRRIIREFIA